MAIKGLIEVFERVSSKGKVYKTYKRAGRYVSAAAYRAQQWRLRGGKAGTARRKAAARKAERAFRAEWGPPPRGQAWVELARKYPERFEEYAEDLYI